MQKKKNVVSFQEFLEHKKVKLGRVKPVDWQAKKNMWIEAVNNLYKMVDEIIIDGFKKAGYSVHLSKLPVTHVEDFIGQYTLDSYVIWANGLNISFNPVGCIIVAAEGWVDMILPGGRIKLFLTDKYQWKIVDGFLMDMKLIDFNEKNIQKIFEGNL